MTEADMIKAKELYKSGKPVTAISKELGVRYEKVLNYLKKEGIHNPKPRGKRGSKKEVKANDNKNTGREITMEEKIAYCDAKYGKGKWYFMTREQFKAEITKSMLKDLEESIDD